MNIVYMQSDASIEQCNFFCWITEYRAKVRWKNRFYMCIRICSSFGLLISFRFFLCFFFFLNFSCCSCYLLNNIHYISCSCYRRTKFYTHCICMVYMVQYIGTVTMLKGMSVRPKAVGLESFVNEQSCCLEGFS